MVVAQAFAMGVCWKARSHVRSICLPMAIRTRQRSQRRTQNLLVGLIGVGLVAVTVGAYVLA